MLSELMSLVVAVSVVAGTFACDSVPARELAQSAPAVAQVADTATARLHISGMT
jgi:hypothetical protein